MSLFKPSLDRSCPSPDLPGTEQSSARSDSTELIPIGLDMTEYGAEDGPHHNTNYSNPLNQPNVTPYGAEGGPSHETKPVDEQAEEQEGNENDRVHPWVSSIFPCFIRSRSNDKFAVAANVQRTGTVSKNVATPSLVNRLGVPIYHSDTGATVPMKSSGVLPVLGEVCLTWKPAKRPLLWQVFLHT
jgi:hypothetical protein